MNQYKQESQQLLAAVDVLMRQVLDQLESVDSKKVDELYAEYCLVKDLRGYARRQRMFADFKQLLHAAGIHERSQHAIMVIGFVNGGYRTMVSAMVFNIMFGGRRQ